MRSLIGIKEIRFEGNIQMSTRRFPPTWTVEEQERWFAVRDRDGQQLAYVYFDDPRAAAIGVNGKCRDTMRGIIRLPSSK